MKEATKQYTQPLCEEYRVMTEDSVASPIEIGDKWGWD